MNRLTRRRMAAVALAVAVLGACSGPRQPLEIATREMPLDLLLGRRVQAVAEAPIPPLVIPRAAFAPGGVFGDDLPIAYEEEDGGPPESVPPPECPDRDLLAVPRLVARNLVEHRPVPATYRYRTEGKLSVAGGKVSFLAPTSTVAVSNIVDESTGWTFDVTMKNTGLSTTTTYRIVTADVDTGSPAGGVTRPPVPEAVPRLAAGSPGLYLAGTDGFRPPFPGLGIARFPLEPGDAFEASASDGDTTVTQEATVSKKAVFDACGTPIDVWLLTLSGRVVSTAGAGPPEIVEFTEILSLGTQYGGLFLLHRTDARSDTAARSIQIQAMTEPVEPK